MKVEIRAHQVILDGYVNAVGRDSRVLPSPNGRFVEQVEPGVFGRAIKKAENIELRYNHGEVIGATKEKTLQLFEDNIGLRAIATITDEKVMEKAKNGELRGWSFGFYKKKDRWEDTGKGYARRFLEDIDLKEVSVLDKTPAYVATSIEQRGEDEVIGETRHLEDLPEQNDIAHPEGPAEEQRVLFHEVYEAEMQILKMRGANS